MVVYNVWCADKEYNGEKIWTEISKETGYIVIYPNAKSAFFDRVRKADMLLEESSIVRLVYLYGLGIFALEYPTYEYNAILDTIVMKNNYVDLKKIKGPGDVNLSGVVQHLAEISRASRCIAKSLENMSGYVEMVEM